MKLEFRFRNHFTSIDGSTAEYFYRTDYKLYSEKDDSHYYLYWIHPYWSIQTQPAPEFSETKGEWRFRPELNTDHIMSLPIVPDISTLSEEELFQFSLVWDDVWGSDVMDMEHLKQIQKHDAISRSKIEPRVITGSHGLIESYRRSSLEY